MSMVSTLAVGFPKSCATVESSTAPLRRASACRGQRHCQLRPECGGFMALTESITPRSGVTSEMAGVVPAAVTMQNKLAALGYREVTALADNLLLAQGEMAPPHEFHYSRAEFDRDSLLYAYETVGLRGKGTGRICPRGSLLAGYTHLHFASNPQMIDRFLAACQAYRNSLP